MWESGPLAVNVMQSGAASAAYQGPGDIVSTNPLGWYGLRSYSLAYATSGAKHAIDIVDSAGANPATIDVLTTGALDMTTLNSWIASHGTASVTKLYDQSGAGNHLTQGTVANMPTVNTAAIGSLPGLSFSSVSVTMKAAFGMNSSLCGFSFVYSVSSGIFIFYEQNSLGGIKRPAGNTIQLTGTDANTDSATASDGSFHRVQAVANGSASSSISVDAGSSSQSGTAAFAMSGDAWQIGGDGAGFVGTICEIGAWDTDFTSSFSALDSNQKTYWGL